MAITQYSKLKKKLGDDYDSIKGKTVTIAGIGSLGSLLSEALARAGVNIRMIDMGRVKIPDLPTLTLFTKSQDRKFKAKEAKKRIEKINPDITVKTFHEKLSEQNLFLLESDLIVDCTHDEKTSKLINAYCKKEKIPRIYTNLQGSKVVIHHGNEEGLKEEKKLEGEKGLLSSTAYLATANVLTKIFKILSGKKVKKTELLDAWK